MSYIKGYNKYGEGWFYNNAVPITIETVDVPIGMYGPIAGLNNGITFDSGSVGATSAFADYSGTVTGTVLVTSAAHGLSTGDVITIMGSTSYNGVFQVTVVSTSTFYIVDTWVADDGVSTWIQPAHGLVSVGSAGIYNLEAHITINPSATCTVSWMPYINTTPQYKGTIERYFPVHDLGGGSFTLLVEFNDGDIVWMSMLCDTLTNILPKHGGMRFSKVGD